MEESKTDEKQWYILCFISKSGKPSPQKYIDAFNREGHSLELFAPIIRLAHVVNGKVEYKEKLLTYFYVFVKGTFDEIKELCSRRDNNLSFLLDKGSERRYGIINELDMNSFKIIARAHTNTIPFFNIDDIELSEGDIVEVVDGRYSGLRGTFMSKPRSNRGNLVIAATACLGAVVWNIDAKYVRILKFAHDTRRQYDIIDSFIPRLLPVLRKFHLQENLTDKEKTTLSVFNQRMNVVALNNHKLEAKLMATLMCVQTIIGDIEGYKISSTRFDKRKSSVTNPWTKALIELMISVADNDISRLKQAYIVIKSSSDDLTKTRKQLLDEYRFYIQD